MKFYFISPKNCVLRTVDVFSLEDPTPLSGTPWSSRLSGSLSESELSLLLSNVERLSLLLSIMDRFPETSLFMFKLLSSSLLLNSIELLLSELFEVLLPFDLLSPLLLLLLDLLSPMLLLLFEMFSDSCLESDETWREMKWKTFFTEKKMKSFSHLKIISNRFHDLGTRNKSGKDTNDVMPIIFRLPSVILNTFQSLIFRIQILNQGCS